MEEMKNGEVNTPEIKSEAAAGPTETIGKGNQDDKTGYNIIYLANYHKNFCISRTFLLKYRGPKSWVQLICETIAFRRRKVAGVQTSLLYITAWLLSKCS